MDTVYKKEDVIAPSLCDGTARLSVPNTFALFMDIAAEHAENLGIGAYALSKKDLFWLTVRTKLAIKKRPAIMSNTAAATWPGRPERFRCMRYYTLEKDGEMLIEGKTEWAILNMKTQKLVRADEVYPEELTLTDETACESPFERIMEDIPEKNERAAYTVKSTDIDLGGHMNNAAYIRALFSAFTSKELEGMRIREMEAAFRAQTYEGETLSIRARDIEGGMEAVLVKDDGKAALAARMLF